MKKSLTKGISIVALSLGLLFSPPNITPHISNALYAQEESRWEYSKHGWDFTREETKKIYEKEYEEGERLKNPVTLKDDKYIAYYNEETFKVPEKFLTQTLKHLEQMLEKGYAEYIFRLDAYHSHLFIPKEKSPKYKDLKGVECIKAYMEDESLGALYHNSEHLTAKDPQTGKIDPKAEDLIRKRNVLGWYGRREIELTYPAEDTLPKLKEANSAGIPENTFYVGNLNFRATKNGEFVIRPNGKEIRVDISFDDLIYY